MHSRGTRALFNVDGRSSPSLKECPEVKGVFFSISILKVRKEREKSTLVVVLLLLPQLLLAVTTMSPPPRTCAWIF